MILKLSQRILKTENNDLNCTIQKAKIKVEIQQI